MRRTARADRDSRWRSHQTFFGRSIYGREGRRIGSFRSPGIGHPYSIVELSGFSNSSEDLRALPSRALAYDGDRGHFLCDLSELTVRNAPAYRGSADWGNERWRSQLDTYFGRQTA